MIELNCRKQQNHRGSFINMCNNHNIKTLRKSTVEILSDKNGQGKERDWKGKKKKSVLMADHFGYAGLENKSKRMRECADLLVFRKSDDRLKLYQAWFCKVRLCPMCNWRRSLKIAYQNKKIIEAVNERENVRWLFLTLTVRNVGDDRLKETISDMFEGFRRLTMYKSFKTSVRGYFRALEVTKNRDPKSEWENTYHPHFHVLLCVPASYFGNLYIKQSEWAAMWKKSLKLDYSPIVHVQRVKPKNNLNDLETYETQMKKAIFEVSKYPIKDSDIILGNEVTPEGVETVSVLDDALAYKRLIGYGGLLRDVHKELNLDDSEDGNLINVSNEDEVSNGAFEVMAKWHIGYKDYIIYND